MYQDTRKNQGFQGGMSSVYNQTRPALESMNIGSASSSQFSNDPGSGYLMELASLTSQSNIQSNNY
jgi:hypothetical protein